MANFPGLDKAHNKDCKRPKKPEACDCQWRGRRMMDGVPIFVPLATWHGAPLDPRKLGPAQAVWAEVYVLIGQRKFDPRGRQVVVAVNGTRLRDLIDQWHREYVPTAGAGKKPLKQNSLPAMLHVLQTDKSHDGVVLGLQAVAQLVAQPKVIEDWLMSVRNHGRITANRCKPGGTPTFRTVEWSDETHDRYLSLLHRIFEWAVTVKRVSDNPCAGIRPMSTVDYHDEHRPIQRLEEDAEDRLFAACAKLNEPRVKAFSAATLTFKKAEAIRARVAKGERQCDVADALDITRSVVCDIVNGKIWTSPTYARSTKGSEMERRLIGGFDAGLRIGEMMRVQVEDVDYRPVVIKQDDGTTVRVYRITLHETKAGKKQYVWAGSERFKAMLDQRRFLGPKAFVFGTERGGYQKGFRAQVVKLFELAELPYGRDIGQTWHTTRHEFISRIAEDTRNPQTIKDAARHANLRTSERYIHSRQNAVASAFAGVGRRRTA